MISQGLLLTVCLITIAVSAVSLVYSLLMWRLLKDLKEQALVFLKTSGAHYESASNALALVVKQTEILDQQINLVEEIGVLAKKNLTRLIEVLKLLD